MTARDEIENLLSKLRTDIPPQPVGTCANCIIYKRLAASKSLNTEAADLIEKLIKEKENGN